MSLMIEDVETGVQVWGAPDVDLASGWCTLAGYPIWSARAGRVIGVNHRTRIDEHAWPSKWEVVVPVTEAPTRIWDLEANRELNGYSITTWRFRWDGKSVDLWGCPLLTRVDEDDRKGTGVREHGRTA